MTQFNFLQGLFAVSCCLAAFSSQAQIDGDNIFGTDQVVKIELDFPDADYWTQLENNYDDGENVYIPAALTLTDVTGESFMDSVGVRFKGNSSYNHPGDKKSFKIDFNKFVTGQDYDGIKKLNFSNGFKDPSMIREKVFFDVCRAAWVPAPRASFADVFFNGTHLGFYTIVEQIDDQFLDWRILDDDGNLFKAGDNFGGGPDGGGNEADLAYYGPDQVTYEERYELKTNEDVNDWSDLIELIDFIDNSSDEVFGAEFGDHIDMVEYVRSMALDILFSNLDSYAGSARNYYIYHNLTTGKWEWIKWDGNESFGSYNNGAGDMISLGMEYHDTPRPLLSRMLDDEDLNFLYRTQLCYLMENWFNSEYMDARIDEIVALVQDFVYADDNKMYTDDDFDTNIEMDITSGGGPGGGTTYGLKSFVEERYDYMMSQLDCEMYVGVDELDDLEVEFYPNPAEDRVNVQWAKDDVVAVRVIDTQGRIQAQHSAYKLTGMELDVSDLSAGGYFIELEMNSGQHARFRLMLH